ncbi:MAG: S1C family serine protease [Lachnospiraceae bacterium]|jgi:serine protease Do
MDENMERNKGNENPLNMDGENGFVMSAPSNDKEEKKDDFFADGSPARERRNTYHFEKPLNDPPHGSKKKKERRHNDNRKKDGITGLGAKIIVTLVIAVIFGLVSGLVFVGVNKLAGGSEKTEQSEISKQEEKEIDDIFDDDDADDQKEESQTVTFAEPVDQSGQMTVAQVAEKSMPAMVSITNMSVQQVQTWMGQQSYESSSAGSGIIIGKTDTQLLIATNQHVIADANSLTVCFIDESVIPAVVKGEDDNLDLAVVAVNISDISSETMDKIDIIPIGSSDDTAVGENVVAIGNALGYGQSVSAGIVSAKDRHVQSLNNPLIVTDAAINPGNSGGALLNMKGELIGINEAKNISTSVEGVGYAIPISDAEPILNDLMNRASRTKVDSDKAGFLGIASSYNIDSTRAEQNNAPVGIYVEYLINGCAAAQAGIRPGDIITAVNEYSVSDMDDLRSELEYYEVGETVQITLYRYGTDSYEKQVLDVTLGEQPEDETLSQYGIQSESGQNNSDESAQDGAQNNGSGNFAEDIKDIFGW